MVAVTMILALLFAILADAPSYAIAMQIAALVAVASFILTRPTRPR